MSISCGEKNHPFSDVALRNIRQCLGATPEDGIAEGQPFFLTLISTLAKESGDPDWKYPLTLQEGVPIGVDEPTLTSPGVWPTKEELRGSPDDWEDLPSPTGRHNYDSAEAFSDSIKETFIEEKAMGLVEGPFTRKQQTDVDAIRLNSVLGLWRPLMKETRFVPFMMVALVGRMPISNRTAQRKQQHPQ